MRLDCLTRTWHTHVTSLPVSQDIDYGDGLYGHSLVAHGKVLVLFGGLLYVVANDAPKASSDSKKGK